MERPTPIYRLRTDFNLAIITLFGACSIVLILPFAVYRLLSGNMLAAALDTGLVVGILAPVAYAWRTGDTRRSGWVMALIYSSGSVASAALLGVVGLFWIYPTIFANFFLTGRRAAVLITAGTLLALLLFGKGFVNVSQMLSFVATSVLVSLLSFILANRTEAQRAQLEQQASRDPLTGIHNRRAMIEELALAVQLWQRQKIPVSLIILDIDHFKRINDTHGHAEGDATLIGLTELVRDSIRATDRFFRYGGEEFVLLLPGVAQSDISVIANALRERIASNLRAGGIAVTVSLGAAQLVDQEDWQSWLRRADQALYEAKSAGRNRVVLA
jgi:diguanylate cyclase (GGDEF)-like protein